MFDAGRIVVCDDKGKDREKAINIIKKYYIYSSEDVRM